MIPTEQDLAGWFMTQSPDATVRQMVLNACQEKAWLVSVKRMRSIRANGSSSTRGHLTSIASQTLERPCLEDIAAVLNVTHVRLAGRFYDRNPDILDWYYEICVADPPVQGCYNPIAGIFLNGDHCYGNVVIMKNGPDLGTWEPSIDLTALSKTIWWSFRSGNHKEIVGARDMERVLKTYY
ncbi:hypothetical protein B0H10DRAFT_1969073 [Mycena sp. CBHHK59/15]|nr:hypothetical protein B0H10DRAFT_1969073 [Mycena sp. CBHHK59/15]